MYTEVEQKWKGLSPTAFDKYVDKLSSEQYRSMCATDPEFFEAVNITPHKRKTWGKDANYTIKKDSALGQFVAEEEHERTRPERELHGQIADMVEKDLAATKLKLRTRLDSGLGLDKQLCGWVGLPKNIPITPNPVAGFSCAGLAAVKAAWAKFAERHETDGRFTEDEKDILIRTMSDACGIVGKVFDMRSEVSWEAVYMVCLMAGRIKPNRTKAVEEQEEPSMATRIANMVADPTPADRKRAYLNDVVFHSRGLSRDLTKADIDGLLGDDYKTIVDEGYSTDGKILRNTNDLLPGRGAR
jgi:hypothetical protein